MNPHKNQVSDIVSEIVLSYSRYPRIADDQHLIEDLGFDSLDFVGLVAELENLFDISIPDQDLYVSENFQTIKHITAYIKRKTCDEES